MAGFIKAIDVESSKSGLAPGNAFVMVEWCSILIQEMTGTDLWGSFGIQVVDCNGRVLELCLGESRRPNVRHTALVVTRRGLRKAFSKVETREAVIHEIVKKLSAKGSQPSAKNATMLGVIAGVCARKPEAKEILIKKKSDYYAFYVREIIGSKTPVPKHIASALGDYFVDFATKEEIQKEVVPGLEKALLRAPEIVLNDLVTPLFHSLPESIDLSDVLRNNLLKPLLSNIKSTNATIRQGALSAFKAAVLKCRDPEVTAQIADEILTPLKTGKLPSADQRAYHADMLAVLPASREAAAKLSPALSSTAAKEANEAALYSETNALLCYLKEGLKHDMELDKQVVDAFAKGVSDKKVPVKKLWATRLGELFWATNDAVVLESKLSRLAEAVIPGLMETWQEATSNSIQAAQSGLVTGAYMLTAISRAKLELVSSSKVDAALKKAHIAQQALTTEPKPSFLLNPRIFSKLTSEDDFRWFMRALASVSQDLISLEPRSSTSIAWSQAMIFCLCSSSVTPLLRKEASLILSQMYVKAPAKISKIIIAGLWEWRDSVEQGDKDSAAAAAKTETRELHLVVRSICLSPGEIEEFGGIVEDAVKKEQMISLLILSRPELLPRVNWIDLCLKVQVDPGDLARVSGDSLMQKILDCTTFNATVCISV